MAFRDLRLFSLLALLLIVSACGSSRSNDGTVSSSPTTGTGNGTADVMEANDGIVEDESSSPVESTPQNTSEPDDLDTPDSSQVVNGYMLVRNERVRPDGTVNWIGEFEHDFVNNRITLKFSSENDLENRQPFTVSSYDEAGNRTHIEDSSTNPINGEFSTASRSEFLYDSEGTLIAENTFLLSDGLQYAAIDYRYYPDGRLEGKRDPDPEGGRRLATAYNEQNQLISTTLDFPRASDTSLGQTQFIKLFGYEPGSVLIHRVESFDETGRSTGGYSLYRYDSNGNMIRTDWFDADGTLRFSDRFIYEQSPEPVYNFWLNISRFFPEDMRFPFL